jgi:hypothetical protein
MSIPKPRWEEWSQLTTERKPVPPPASRPFEDPPTPRSGIGVLLGIVFIAIVAIVFIVQAFLGSWK